MIDFKIKIVDKIIHFKADTAALVYEAAKNERDFKYFLYRGAAKVDLTFAIKYGYTPGFKGKKSLFTVDNNWSLWNYKGNALFAYPDRGLPGRMERMALINAEMTKGTIYVNKLRTAEEGEKKTPEKLGREVISEIKANFFQAFLVEYIISKEIGFLVHCASVYQEGKLYLFMGQTRSGKSTIADFWHRQARATVFNDDRAILSFKEGRAYFYNAPWVGALVDKCEVGGGNRTEVDRIFFIYQNDANTLSRLNKVQAAAKIFKNSFSVFWKKEALHYVLGLCSKIVDTVPCYDLGFVHNESVVKFLKEKLNAQKTKEAMV